MVWVDRTDGQTGFPRGTIDAVITLRLFAQARESAGTKSVDVAGDTVGDVLDEAVRRFGEPFAAVLAGSKVWLNGSPAERQSSVASGDEVAVLPPVSGG
jgi:molybdopterin synthase sulfur carrier subunit